MSELPRAPAPKRPGFAPRNWGGWLVVAFLWFLGHLPRRVGRWLVAPLAPLFKALMGSRQRIAHRNLELCMPELDQAGRQAIVDGCFRSIARMVAEMAWCWAGPAKDIVGITRISDESMARLDAAVADGHGVLVVTAHVTCLEIGARVLGEMYPGQGVYRPLGNEVIEWYQNRGRAWYAEGMISKRDVRSLVRLLKRGGFVWYAADQDFGAGQSEFAPFFGVPTATLLATHRLPKLTGCKVMTMLPRYVEDEDRYEIEVSPVFEDFPSDDPVADLARVNAVLEAQVRQAPDQYWWIHRRFKTRPPGEADLYGKDARSS